VCSGVLQSHWQGGILGDDMGLGKTVQITAFLGGLFYSDLTKHVLIVVPKSLINQWEKECVKWYVFVSSSFFFTSLRITY
jgi:SNF2 family DNA or RNA helicase